MLFTFLKLYNTTLLCHTNHTWTYHIKTSTQPPLSQSFETTPDINQPTKSAHPSLVLLPSLKQVLKTQETSLFQPFPSQSNHHKREFSIITGKFDRALQNWTPSQVFVRDFAVIFSNFTKFVSLEEHLPSTTPLRDHSIII